MIRYLFFSAVALSLLACPSKPRRRPPTLPVVKTDDANKTLPNNTSSTQVSLKDGIYFALQGGELGYQPQVLQASDNAIIPLPVVKISYNKVTPYQFSSQQLQQKTSDLATAGGNAISLLLEFKVDADSYCVAFPLTQVIQYWVRVAAAVYEINYKLQQVRAQPVDISGNKGKLQNAEDGVWQCST